MPYGISNFSSQVYSSLPNNAAKKAIEKRQKQKEKNEANKAKRIANNKKRNTNKKAANSKTVGVNNWLQYYKNNPSKRANIIRIVYKKPNTMFKGRNKEFIVLMESLVKSNCKKHRNNCNNKEWGWTK